MGGGGERGRERCGRGGKNDRGEGAKNKREHPEIGKWGR